MAACEETAWNITLRIDHDAEREETIFFRDIRITGGAIEGKVFVQDPSDPDNFMSILRGRCSPATPQGHREMSHLEFVFNVVDASERLMVLILYGVGYLPLSSPDKKEFRGSLRAYIPYSGGTSGFSIETEEPRGHLEELVFDEGDTGTGTGTQT